MSVKKLLYASALVVASSSTVLAQPEESGIGIDRAVAPAHDSVEITIGAGYAQGTGDVAGGMAVEDVAGPGGAVEVQLGYRLVPAFTLGVYGTLSGFDQGDLIEDTTDIWGASAGVVGTFHLRPGQALAPWASLGAGWKTLQLASERGDDVSLQGLDLARVQVGLDYRISPEVAISPVIGGSLSTYLAQDAAMTDGYDEIEDKELTYSLFAGLLGRFNL